MTWSDLAQDASSVITKTLAFGQTMATKDDVTECVIGSHIEWIYFEINFAAEAITNPKVIHWTVEVVPTGMTNAVPSLYYQPNRAYVLKRGMEMLPKDVGTVYKRIFVVKIPKQYQRIKDNAAFVFKYIATLSETVNVCGFAIYKEIY